MKIDNVNISVYKAILTKKDIQNSEIITYGDWLRNSHNPLVFDQKERYTSISIRLLIEGDTPEVAETLVSTVISKCKKCIITFDDASFYDCFLETHSEKELLLNVYELNIEFKSGFKYKTQVNEVANRIDSKTINVSGNLETPAIVEITPSINIIDLVVTGVGESFTIKNLTAGQKVIVNGEDGTVLQGSTNKFLDYDGWDFPKLKPGSNRNNYSKSSCDITIKYKPRFI